MRKGDAALKKAPTGRKKLLFLVLNFAVCFTVYQLLLALHPFAATILYIAAALALAIAYCIVNQGFGAPVTDGDALPASWSAVEKCAYAEDARARHERAKGILLWLFPVILTLLLDVTYLFLLQPLFEAIGIHLF